MPKCKKCNCEKPLEDFNLRDKEKQIPTTYCKQCNKEKVKAWRKTEKGSKKWKEYQKDKVQRVRKWLQDQKALGCERCGDSRYYVIDFHHIDPSTKKFTIGSGYANSNFKQTREEVAKCRRLCANCHREEHYINNQKVLDNHNK